jgi:hypothetical protein
MFSERSRLLREDLEAWVCDLVNISFDEVIIDSSELFIDFSACIMMKRRGGLCESA